MEFYQSYHPITATPFICNDQYMEFQPCSALKPYIKCFWGTKKPAKQSKTNIPTERIITPDTCMDIIFEVDYSSNKIASIFCGIDDHTFCTHNDNREEKVYSTFAIRFYAWSAMLFSEESMCDTRNGRFDAVRHFPKITREIEPLLFDIADMDGFITIAEQVLLKNFCERHKNAVVSESVAQILRCKGNLRAEQLAKELHISSRQLQRLFQKYVGVSPKKLSSLVRYQYLWHDIVCSPRFDVSDAVYRYGYTDQSHLLHEFKEFHSMNITQAREYAQQYVAFLQA